MDLQQQYDKIYRYCFRRLGDRSLAEDVTQETFLRFLSAEGYHSQGKALRYLYTVARNLCVDEYRRAKPGPLPEELAAPEGELDSLALRQALAALSQEEQELVLMRYVNQEPVSVIAAHMGMSRFAVYRRTTAALEKLRWAMEEDAP